MANNHSAEFLRGAKWWADQHTTGYKQLCALLAAAEAREAFPIPDTLPAVPEAHEAGKPTAAEVIAAAEKALAELLGATGTIEVLGEYEALEINASSRRKMRARVDGIEDGCRESLALIARWKEANHVK